MSRLHRLPTVLAALALAAVFLGACGGDSPAAPADAAGGAPTSRPERVTLRLGYFPNVTHATAIAGVEEGIFADALGSGVKLETQTFNAGPEVVEAIFSGALDASYIGPNPAINAFAQSKGEAIRIVAGATSGGAALVVKPSIAEAADLRGKKIASPQLGNTQDVALRAWLKSQGLATDLQGGGDVAIVPQPNAQTLETFRSGDIDGAWVPEPWATRLVQEGGGRVLVDEGTLWPEGRFVTTQLIVRTAFLDDHPDVVRGLLEGHVAATRFVNERPENAKGVVNKAITALTGKGLPAAVIEEAWGNLEFTVDPLASTLRKSARDAESLGLLEPVELDGIYDLSLLNRVLTAAGRPEVKA